MAEVIHDAAENHVNGFDQLDNLKHQMELRGSELGKTWAELSRIMSQYQNQLIQKHDNYKTNLSTDDQHRVAKLETVIEKKALQIQQLEKANDDLSTRLLEKDSEIVRLRTEVHQSKNEVSMKDALIDKLQSQMAKEALEYQTEVTSLKEMLVQGVTSEVTSREQTEEGDGTGATNLTPTTPGPGGKRRRLAPSKAVTSTPVSVTSASTSSHASDELLLQASIRTVTFPSSASSDALNPQTLTSRPAFPDSLTSASIDEPLEMEAYGGFTEDEENYYKGEEVSEDSLARFELEEADSSQLDMSGQETVFTPRKRDINAPQNKNPEQRPPAKCPICGRVLHYTGLARHLRSHAGARPYKCALCERAFTQRHVCRTHIRQRHGEEILQVQGALDNDTLANYIVTLDHENPAKTNMVPVKSVTVVQGKNL